MCNPPYVGVWHGGHNYSNTDPDLQLERFLGLDDAVNAIVERYEANGRACTFKFANGEVTRDFVPCVDMSCTIDLWSGDERHENGHDVRLSLAEHNEDVVVVVTRG